ncbi:hypothetical protein HYU93_03590 [Candidatus Daviesbacteria bacterium]|nr:hypothetical protein [Candidatus Daviesbacteria bacterium]
MKTILISPLYQYIRDFSGDTAPPGAPDVLLHRLPGFIQEFNSIPILPDFLYELESNLALKHSLI